MPDKTPSKRTWTVNDITTILAAVFSGLALLISTWNSTKNDHIISTMRHVVAQQDEQTMKAEVIASDLAIATKATKESDAKLDKIVEKTADVKNSIQVIDSKLKK